MFASALLVQLLGVQATVAQKKNGKDLLYTKLKGKTKVLKELQDLGVVSTTVLRDIEIFEAFHENPDLCKECRYEVLAEVYGFRNSVSIKKIIEKLSA